MSGLKYASKDHSHLVMQVLHVAVLRKHTPTVESLLAAGFPVSEESARGWLALDVAVEAEDRPMVKASAVVAGRIRIEVRVRYTVRLGSVSGSVLRVVCHGQTALLSIVLCPASKRRARGCYLARQWHGTRPAILSLRMLCCSVWLSLNA